MINQALEKGHINKKVEFSRIQFNRSKLRNEDRMLNLILQRVYGVKKRMGAEFALEDTVAYLKRWKKSINEWQKLSKIKLTQLEPLPKKGKTGNFCPVNLTSRGTDE
jgi:hypothetical protein